MGWLRKIFGTADDVWAEAATKLGAEFTRGKWLANNEIKLLHRGITITLGAEFDSDSDSGTEYTRAVPGVTLDPTAKLALFPRAKGLMGSFATRMVSLTGTTISIPRLDEEYLVFADNESLANEVFSNPNFVSALNRLPQTPKVVVGRTLSPGRLDGKDEDDVYVSVRGVLKDIHQLVALAQLTSILLDLLDENGCLNTN